jgi:hypothetical protein
MPPRGIVRRNNQTPCQSQIKLHARTKPQIKPRPNSLSQAYCIPNAKREDGKKEVVKPNPNWLDGDLAEALKAQRVLNRAEALEAKGVVSMADAREGHRVVDSAEVIEVCYVVIHFTESIEEG